MRGARGGRGGSRVDAIVVAGGRSARLGGYPKAQLVRGGHSLVAGAVEASFALGAERVALVGPRDSLWSALDAETRRAVTAGRCLLTQEDPPFTGPAQATAAGVAALGLMEESSGVVLLLACDIPAADAALTAALEWLLASDLLQGDSPRWDGVVCTDTSGHEQWLLGCYRASALARVCAQLGSDQRSMRALLGDLRLARLTIDESTAADIDTWEAAEQLGYTVSPPYLDKSQLETATAKLN